jgi:hypothetical protein
MGLDVWFKDDVRNILLGLDMATAHLASNYTQPEVRSYQDGFEAALVALAVSFGIRPREIIVRTIDGDRDVRALAPPSDR